MKFIKTLDGRWLRQDAITSLEVKANAMYTFYALANETFRIGEFSSRQDAERFLNGYADHLEKELAQSQGVLSC